jgi:pyridoxine kinase
MPLVLVLSSHVAASKVGARPVEVALAWGKVDAVVCPTTLLGRHPGWGPPGGGAVPEALLQGMLDGVEASGLFAQFDAVFTGYFATPAQIAIAIKAIAAARAANPSVRVMVDPIMGDDGALYVPEKVAAAIAEELVPRADLIAPNAFEMRRLSGRGIADAADAAAAARALGKPALVSSIRSGAEIGAVYADAAHAFAAFAPHRKTAPHGTGDLLAGVFLAALLNEAGPQEALRRAVGVTADIVAKADLWNAEELPLPAAMDSFVSPAIRVRTIDLGRPDER